MYEDFAPKLARVLTAYSLPVREGDFAMIAGPREAEPLIEALMVAILQRGGFPRLETTTTNQQEILYKYAGDAQLQFVDPVQKALYENCTALFAIHASHNSKQLTGIDPARLALRQKASQPLRDIYNARIDSGALRWNVTAWPTQAAAQEAEMGYLDYVEFMYKACGLHRDDPVAYWREIFERQERLITWLRGKNHVEIHGPGIDLSFDFAGRPWVNCWGDNNFPDGEIFTSPVEDSVNGHVAFSYPTVYNGRELTGVKLTFREGRVVEASAEKGEDYLLSQLNLDEGARRIGEFAIGTNNDIQHFTRNTLFDEKIGGTLHMALGRSYTESGGLNKSAIHWDMVHAMRNGGEVYVDGDLFYRSGEFTVV